MSHTANQEFRVARVVYGVPKDSSSVQKMEHWVKRNCLDYRRDDDGDQVVVTMVLRHPKKGPEIRDNVKHQARRWGFVRRSREQRQVEFTSINSYMEGGVGALLKDNVRELLGSSYEKVKQREQDCKKQRVEQNREKARARRFKAFRVRQRERSLSVVKLYMKAMWDVGKRLLEKEM